MEESFFRASGVDLDVTATIAFVWCRVEGQDGNNLLGSGHIIGEGGLLPPGIQVGQFSVSFILPSDCDIENVRVTDNGSSKNFLTDVTIVPCTSPASIRGAVGDTTGRSVSPGQMN